MLPNAELKWRKGRQSIGIELIFSGGLILSVDIEVDVAKTGDGLCSGVDAGMLRNCIDAASFGDGVRIMKPSGVGGNRPVIFIRI